MMVTHRTASRDAGGPLGRQRRADADLDLDRYLPSLLTWLYNKFSSDASKHYRKRFGFGVTSWRVLAYLGVFETGTGVQICHYIGLDKAAVSRCLSLLKEQGLVRTEPAGGRNVLASLTPEGRSIFEAVVPVAKEREAALLHGISDEERAMLIDLFHRMLANLPRVAEISERED